MTAEAESLEETAPRKVSRGLPDAPQLLEAILEHRGWDVREGQSRMVDIVSDAIESEDWVNGASINAPVGTGKSLGYLVGALPGNQRIVVCTSTKALQNQIVYSELPRLKEDIKELYGYDLTFAMMKGKSNYMCLHRAEALIEGTAPDDDADSLFSELAMEMEDEHIQMLKSLVADVRQAMEEGDATHLDVGDRLAELPPAVRSQINSSNGCPVCRSRWWEQDEGDEEFSEVDDSAPDRKPIPLDDILASSGCAYRTAYAHALNSDIVVINTSLLAAEMLKSRNVWELTPQLLRGAGVIVVDEAHHLTRILTESLKMELDFDEIIGSARTYYRRIAKHRPDLEDRMESASQVLELAHDDIVEIVDSARKSKLRPKITDRLNDLIEQLEQLLVGVDRPGSDVKEWDHKAAKSVDKSVSKITNEVIDPLASAAMAVSLTTEDPETEELDHSYDVTFAGGDMDDAEDQDDYWLRINMVPLDLSGTRSELGRLNTAENLYSNTSTTLVKRTRPKSTMILCSGTITSEAGFTIGMGGSKHHKVPSPFDPTACRLLLTTGFDNPNTYDWKVDAWNVSQKIILAAGGRAMFLTTSYQNLDHFVERALETLPKEMEVLYQGNGMSRSELLQRKADNESSVLFGTTSFWEGVDIPGKALSLVIMDKIMFPHRDDPIMSARRKWMEKHDKNPFMHVDVDQASVMFAQGFGRLIRSVDDRGGVVCLDSRVMESGYYGSSITRILPAATPVTSNLDAFNEWMKWSTECSPDDEIPAPDTELWSPLRIQRPKRGTRRRSRRES